jgi:hypothetical protein
MLSHLLLLALSYLRAAAVLILAIISAAPGRLILAAGETTGGTFIVLIFFASVAIVAVKVADVARPGAETLGRRFVGGGGVLLLFLHLLSGGVAVPGEAVVVAFLLRLPDSKKAKVALPVR